MIFLLAGGPRDGQLVDDMPPGYAAERARRAPIEIVDGMTAVSARWVDASGAVDAADQL